MKTKTRKDSLMGEDFPDGRYTITVDVRSGNVFGAPRVLTQLLARVRADELERASDELLIAAADWYASQLAKKPRRTGTFDAVVLRHAKSLKRRAAHFRKAAQSK